MLSMVEKTIGGGICHAVHQYTKANKKCMKDYDKNKESHLRSIGLSIICMDGQCVTFV